MDAEAALARLAELRSQDAPTHGGRLLSYVYDSGRADLDELAAYVHVSRRQLERMFQKHLYCTPSRLAWSSARQSVETTFSSRM